MDDVLQFVIGTMFLVGVSMVIWATAKGFVHLGEELEAVKAELAKLKARDKASKE